MLQGLHIHQIRLAKLLFALFLAIWVNGVVFRHAHRLADGRLVVHAHPYWPFGKGPILPNNHTAQEILLLDLAANVPLVVSTFFAFIFLLRSRLRSVYRFVYHTRLSVAPFHCFAHRGPPSFSTFPL